MLNKIPPRTEDNLLSAWERYAEPLNSSDLFKKWGGISLISAVLTRKVWLQSNPVMPPLYPNLFVLLCGAPGTGKDIVINTIRRLLAAMLDGMEQQQGVNIGPESLSTKGLVDALDDESALLSFTYIKDGKPTTVHYHSLFIANGELGAFMPDYNTQMVSIINDLYNCKDDFGDQIRGRGERSKIKIENPHLAMLVGTQPAVFARVVPEEAFQMGFTSRLIICNTAAVTPKAFFGSENVETTLFSRIASDLRSLSLLAGEYKPDNAFKEKLNDFSLNNPGAINNSRFVDYNSRRAVHLCKIAMCCAAAESNKLVLEEKHFDQALEYLTASEKTAPSLFDELITSQGFHHSVEQALSKNVETITHAELERKLRKSHKPQEVGHIIRSMIQAGDIEFSNYSGSLPVYKIQRKELSK